MSVTNPFPEFSGDARVAFGYEDVKHYLEKGRRLRSAMWITALKRTVRGLRRMAGHCTGIVTGIVKYRLPVVHCHSPRSPATCQYPRAAGAQ